MSDELDYQQQLQDDHNVMEMLRRMHIERGQVALVLFDEVTVDAKPYLLPTIRPEAFTNNTLHGALMQAAQDKKDLVKALRSAREALHNDFEPDNQSNAWDYANRVCERFKDV